MVLNFQKIENKEIGVSRIIPVLFSENLLKEHKKKLSPIYTESVKEVVQKEIKSFKSDSIFGKADKKKKIKLKKTDLIIQANVLKKMNQTLKFLVSNKNISETIYDYIMESILITNKKLKGRDDDYIIKLIYSFEKNKNETIEKEDVIENTVLCLKQFLQKRKYSQEHIMLKMPFLYHENNLINMWEQESYKPFQHQIDFIEILNHCKEKKITVINSSPIGSGKSVLQTYTCLHAHFQNASKIRERKIFVITCKNNYVIEEIARGCNVENKIGYWFYYKKKLVPSFFCNPIKKNGTPLFLKKQKCQRVEDQYEKFVDMYISMSNTTNMFQRNLSLPDVIFCTPDDCIELLESSFSEKYVNGLVIDEFLIPDFQDSLEKLLKFSYIEKLILLSASAPSTLNDFKIKHSDIYNQIQDSSVKYLYQEIIPSFINCSYTENGEAYNWLPTNEITSLKEIQKFGWYHWRFFSPLTLRDMMKYIGFESYEDLLTEEIGFKTMTQILEYVKKSMHDLSIEKDSLYLEKLKSYKPSRVLEGKKGDKWMIVCENPVHDLLETSKSFVGKTSSDIKTLIEKYEFSEITKNRQREELLKKFDSLKKSKNVEKDSFLIEVQELESEMQQLDSSEIILRSESNAFTYKNIKNVFGELVEEFGENNANALIMCMTEGYITPIEKCATYYNITNSKNFITKKIFVSPIMCFGTDMNLYGVCINCNVDPITLTQAFGRAGRNRKHIEVPVSAPLESLKKLMII